MIQIKLQINGQNFIFWLQSLEKQSLFQKKEFNLFGPQYKHCEVVIFYRNKTFL